MKLRKHLRTQSATIDYIIADFSFGNIGDKDIYFRYCVENRMKLLNEQYDYKLDKILSYIIKYSSFDNLPLESISKIILSLTKVTNVLMKGFNTLISR